MDTNIELGKKLSREERKKLRNQRNRALLQRVREAEFNIRKVRQDEKKILKEKEESPEEIKTPQKSVTRVEKTRKNISIHIEEQKLPKLEITNIDFSVMTKETAEKLSVCEIFSMNTKIDRYNTLDDPRLGTTDSNYLCAHCEKTTDECPGHLGIIRLSFDFIHPHYRNIVINVLRCICLTCNKLLISENVLRDEGFLNKTGINRLKAIADYCDNTSCSNPRCGPPVSFKPSAMDEDSVQRKLKIIVTKGKVQHAEFLKINKIKQTLNAISDKDATLLGFNVKNNHPSNFVVDFIPIIPITDRPPNVHDSEKRDHPLTYFYELILNNLLQYDALTDENQKEEKLENIIYAYQHLIRNKGGEVKKNQQEILSSINESLTNKNGLVRGHLLGKRCNYTGRSPIGPNRKLSFGYFAPSYKMKELTLPETITRYNHDRIMKLAKEGEIQFLCPSKGNLSGVKLKFNYEKHKDQLAFGDIIDRNSQDGDVFIFNRQPTLHRHSILSYIADFQDKYSIGVHLSSTEGHNADFDGDEGNLHLVQTVESQVEARIVMSAVNCMISGSKSFPKSTIVYNALSGAYLLSDNDLILSKEDFNEGLNLVFDYSVNDYARKNYETLNERLDGINPYSGQALCSIIFPPDFWHLDDHYKNEIFISKGVLRKGRLRKPNLNGSFKANRPSIIQNIWKWYGKETAANFITVTNFLFNWYLTKIGFSLSLEDCSLGENKETFDNFKKNEIAKMNKQLIEIETLPLGADENEIIEQENKILRIISKTDSDIVKKADSFIDKENNSIGVMEMSGAKGKQKNTANVIGAVCQNYVNQRLPEKTLSGGKRWITTFSIYDKRAQATGFAAESFLEGLDPDAYFAQAQGGRIGLIDTAIKTAKVGYAQRKLAKAQEDLKINYDGSVRNLKDIIYQFTYSPGFNTEHMVIDDSDDGFQKYSFIKIKELCGRINSQNGFENFDITNYIKDIITTNGGIINDFNDKNDIDEDEYASIFNESDYENSSDDFED